MSVTIAWIIMTPEQKDEAVALDNQHEALGPREIVNVLANNLGYGTLVGKWVAPAVLLNNPDYARWWPVLGSLDIRIMEDSVLFAPPPEL